MPYFNRDPFYPFKIRLRSTPKKREGVQGKNALWHTLQKTVDIPPGAKTVRISVNLRDGAVDVVPDEKGDFVWVGVLFGRGQTNYSGQSSQYKYRNRY